MLNKSLIRYASIIALCSSFGAFAGDIHEATRKNKWDLFIEFLQRGVNINDLEEGERTALDIVYETDPSNDERIEWLRARGARRMDELSPAERLARISDFVFYSPRPPSPIHAGVPQTELHVTVAAPDALRIAALRLELLAEAEEEQTIPPADIVTPVQMDEQPSPRRVNTPRKKVSGCCRCGFFN